jgi:hypothetical protein
LRTPKNNNTFQDSKQRATCNFPCTIISSKKINIPEQRPQKLSIRLEQRSVCLRSAPVALLRLPSSMFSAPHLQRPRISITSGPTPLPPRAILQLSTSLSASLSSASSFDTSLHHTTTKDTMKLLNAAQAPPILLVILPLEYLHQSLYHILSCDQFVCQPVQIMLIN